MNHRDTEAQRAHRAIAIAMCPQITQIDADGRSRNPSAWRDPGRRRTTAGDRWIGQPLRAHAPVADARSSGLHSRRAQASPLLVFSCLICGSTIQTREGQAEPTSPGRVVRWESTAARDACVRSRRTFPPVAAIVRSPTFPPSILGTAASTRLSASICVICGHIAMGERLCDVFLCVSLCVLCASVVHRAGGWASCRFLDTPADTWRKTPLPVRVGRAESGR